MDRQYHSEFRQQWNKHIKSVMDAMDQHARYPDDPFHVNRFNHLKQYIIDLKQWILTKENS